MSPKFKKMREYRRDAEQRESHTREQKLKEARAMDAERINHFVQVLEQFTEAVVKHTTTQTIEDMVTLNRAREYLTNELTHLVEINRTPSE
jgi:hypothetical protein